MDPAGSLVHSQNRVNWMETRRGHDAILGIVTRLVTRVVLELPLESLENSTTSLGDLEI